MAVKKIMLAENYRISMAFWEGTKPSETIWWTPGLAPDTVVNEVRCYLRCKKLIASPYREFTFGFFKFEQEPCKVHPLIANKFELNGVTVFEKNAHVTLDQFADGKAYMSRERNATRIILKKTRWLYASAFDALYDVWVEIDYSGGEPNPDILASTEPPAPITTPDLTPNPTLPYMSSPFLGEFSTLFLLVIVVMIFVLIISAVRRRS